MIHLQDADYSRQPWKNGRGTTTELWRLEHDGVLLVRLSRASVVEDGPFSVFPGIERNLTVLTGPGFRLVGAGLDLQCDPLTPVAFPGDLPMIATDTGGQQSDDFNVMTSTKLPRPEVRVCQEVDLPAGGTLALYALGACRANRADMAPNDLVLSDEAVCVTGHGPVIAVRIFGL